MFLVHCRNVTLYTNYANCMLIAKLTASSRFYTYVNVLIIVCHCGFGTIISLYKFSFSCIITVFSEAIYINISVTLNVMVLTFL